MSKSVRKSEEEWRRTLSAEEYQVLRKKGTERAFTGEYWDEARRGTYRCKGCGTALFSSETKYDAGCGWPSFHETMGEEVVRTKTDRSHFMVRTEVLCATCEGHLGHVFPDGPGPSGMRYCINSASLDLEAEEGSAEPETDASAGEPATE